MGGDDSWELGGLCGFNWEGTITNCYATGSVSGGGISRFLGGLCGRNREGTIRNSYATGSVSGGDYLGGLCGYNYGGTIENCYWDKDASEIDTSSSGTGLTTAEMQAQSTFTDADWDYVNEDTNGQMDLWYQRPGEYPKLFWQTIQGDSSYDGYVGEADMIIMAEQWLQAPPEQTRLEADSNFDEYVDILDFAIFSENWLIAE
ncbi:GLUG domain protein [Sedimentisphaera salicampi]|nr:GLUG domain protein [Sedimentisphaera salicampi]